MHFRIKYVTWHSRIIFFKHDYTVFYSSITISYFSNVHPQLSIIRSPYFIRSNDHNNSTTTTRWFHNQTSIINIEPLGLYSMYSLLPGPSDQLYNSQIMYIIQRSILEGLITVTSLIMSFYWSNISINHHVMAYNILYMFSRLYHIVYVR